MDESALRSLIASLDKQGGGLHWWLHFWTWMVIIGCAGELIFVIHDHLDDRRLWYKARTNGFIAFPERPSLSVLALELLSVAFVVVGIAGELNVDFKSGRLETQLRDANTKLVLLLEGKANDAETAARGAASAAGQAEASSGRALNLSNRATASASNAIALADVAKKDSGDAIVRAENVRDEAEWLAKFAALSVNRRMIDRKKFADMLKGQPKGSVEIWYEPHENEARIFAGDLKTALVDNAGWEATASPFPTEYADLEVTPRRGLNMLRIQADDDGMAIGAPSRDVVFDPKSQLSALRDAIRMSAGGGNVSGLQITLGDPDIPEGHFVIAIGRHQAFAPWVEHPPKQTTAPTSKPN